MPRVITQSNQSVSAIISHYAKRVDPQQLKKKKNPFPPAVCIYMAARGLALYSVAIYMRHSLVLGTCTQHCNQAVIDNQGPIGHVPNHVITVTANNSDHMT